MGSSGLGRPRGAERIWSNFGSTVLFNNPYHDSTIAAIRDHRTGFRLPHVARRTPLTSLIYAVTFDGDVARRPEEGRHTTRRVPKRTGMQCTSSRTRGEPEYPTAAGAAGAAWFAACWVLGSTALLSVSRGRGARSGSTLLRAVRLREMRCRAPHWSATRRRAAGRGCVSFAVSGVLTVGVPSRVPAFFPRLSPLGASSFRASADASIAYTAGDRASVSARARGPGGQVPPAADTGH